MLKVFNILIACVLLSACISSSTTAPVSHRSALYSTKVVGGSAKLKRHVVAPGETLYAIAWRYGLDYKDLARINDIGPGYSIFPNQIISLKKYSKELSKSREPAKRKNKTLIEGGSPIKSRSLATDTSASLPKSKSTPKSGASSQASSKIKSTQRTLSQAKTTPKQKISWRWPAGGKVLTNYKVNDDLKGGIDIVGKKGDSVIAAASGQVVYAGSGLRAYGKLVIIKHSDTYLSAYAHNHRLRVKEGDLVKVGQRIADIGATGTGANGKTKLHFQIRREGKPINPLLLLPKRKA